MRSPIHYVFFYVFPLLWVIGAYLGGLWHYLTVFMAYVCVPLLDQIIGPKPRFVAKESYKDLAKDKRYRIALYLYAPINIGLVIWGAYFVSSKDLALYEWAGFVVSSALMTGGLGMTVAHELCHSPKRFEQLLADMLLIPVCYMHFSIEHVFGHHSRVATKEDPATARLGESLYRFIPRSIFGGIKSAFYLEAHRLKKRRKSLFSIDNKMIWYTITPALFAVFLYSLFGVWALVYFLVQAFIGFNYLEVINYVEHYGLMRKKDENGRYEKTSHLHSWNSDHIISNHLLFGLPTHSDHHASSRKPYQTLQSIKGSPQLPASYGAMMPLAFFPFLWRRVMDHRVKDRFAGGVV